MAEIYRDLRSLRFRQFMLGSNHRLAHRLKNLGIPAERLSSARFDFSEDQCDYAIVEIVPPQMSVAVCREHLKYSFFEFQDRNIESASAQIINRDNRLFAFVDAVSQRSSGRFVHDAQHFETSEMTRVFRRLSLGVVEVSGDRDKGLSYFLPEEFRSPLF